MFELMKLKYRRHITDTNSAEILIALDRALTGLQSLLLKNTVYCEFEYIECIEPLREKDINLYNVLLSDIKNRTLLQEE